MAKISAVARADSIAVEFLEGSAARHGQRAEAPTPTARQRREARVHTAYDQHDQHDQAPDAGQRAETIAPGDAGDRRSQRWIMLEAQAQHDGVAQRLQQSGQDAGSSRRRSIPRR